VRVVPNPPPVFHNLTGTHWSVASGGELRIDLRDYLSDPNDDFTNFTFNVAWDNGTVVNASLEGGVVVVKPQSELSGRAVITITATDPSSDSDTAEFVVEVTGSALPGGGALLIGLALAFFAAVGITFLLMRSRRKRGRPSLTRFEREQGAAEADEAPALLESPAGLEVTEEERAVHKLDEMEKEAQVSRIELQPATILSLEGPRCADSILLLYRDGQPITWVATHGPSDEERGQAEELAAILRERLKKVRAGERIEGESVAFGGRKIAIEARAQLMAGAVLVNGVDEDAARERIRRALDLIFDNNAGALKRWDGSRSSLKGVDDVLEGAFKLD
jgi:hypothetical protein